MSKKSAAPMFALLATLALGGNAQAAPPPPSPVLTARPVTTAAMVVASAIVPAAPAKAIVKVDGTPITVTVNGKSYKLAPEVQMQAAVGRRPAAGYKTGQLPNAKKCQAPAWQVPGVLDTYANCKYTDPVKNLECQSLYTATRAALCLAPEGQRPLDQDGNPLWVYIPAKQISNGGIYHFTVDQIRAVVEKPVVDNDPDNDGLIGPADKCPNEAGPPSNDGCPDKDTDKDGFFDRIDRCPTEPGVAPDGCPVKTVAAEPAPPAAATLVAAPETPKAAKNDEKKVFGTAAVKIGTDTTKTTVGSLNVSLLAGLCATGNALQQNVKTADGKNLVKPWFFCPTVSFGQATRWYPRGAEATHLAFSAEISFLTGIRGLNASGSAYRDNMRTNGVFAGPSLWALLTYASFFDQSFIANIGGGAGVQLKAVMGIVTLGIDGGIGVARVAKRGYSPSLLAQPGAEVCGKFDAYVGIAF